MVLSRLGKQITEIISVLNASGVRYALIGGLALALHKVIRATQDVDLLVDAENADEADQALSKLGYRCLHRSAEAGNYLRGDERVDLLYASRPIARRLLAGASEQKTAFGDLRVIGPEGLIGFKLQGWVNDARRTQGPCCAPIAPRWTWRRCASIFVFSTRSPCSMNSCNKPAEHIFAGSGGITAPVSSDRDPFEVLDDLMVVIEALCPTWPPRESIEDTTQLRL